MSLRCLFVVQGEGRGHLTQAMALRHMLQDAGHQVAQVVVGKSDNQAVPTFFREAFEAPVTNIESPGFVSDAADRSVRPWATLRRTLGRTPTFWHSLDTLDAAVERHDPDVVVNFFEPLMGLYAVTHSPSVPVVAVAHQYMFLHPDYRFPAGRWGRRWAARAFARLTAWGASRRLALSLYPAPDRPRESVSVLPPLLRPGVFRQPQGENEPFFLVYILNSGYANEVVRWHEQNPGVRLHCFWDRPDAAPVEAYDETLTFHQLDDEKFLRLMARCRGLVSTAGFESIAEAMYLGTPVQAVPVAGHYEQRCNAVDAVRAGAGVCSTQFNIGRLRTALGRGAEQRGRFRRWVRRGRCQFVRELEAAVREFPAEPTPPLPMEDRILETA
ncbi:glycosyltransferase family protein [Salinibacter altiplanensis]|uniref:glycosyltransferase family protein n=1 Tax=Salinibacter altiplanensis TaxID=1803181 RepID=UPI000C9FBEAB|nr:glycosyltransferase family protein [Salinibacter altiplanensis]